MGGKPQWPTATWQIGALTNSPDEKFLLFVQGVSNFPHPESACLPAMPFRRVHRSMIRTAALR